MTKQRISYVEPETLKDEAMRAELDISCQLQWVSKDG